jgi:two-component system C4-dicarboxylate transport response regulator DctD
MSSDTPISAQAQVVLIDDDPHLRQALSQTLDLAGLEVVSLGDARGLAARLPADWQGVVVSDIRMPGIDGLELLQQLRARDNELPVILITGHGDIQLAVQAMRAGAYDFLEKPFPSEALLDSVRRALALRQLVLDNRSLRLALADRQQLSARLLGQSRAMLRLREQIGALAGTQADVLILGALAESVVESELFGHEPGAFTGAQKRRIGKFEFANGGTLFLDEIESMSLDVQVKLLRLLQERVVERLGGNQSIALDIRVIAATKEDLRVAADQGRFRADLYYRLNVAPLRIPSLRERSEDILLLFQHFAEAAAQRHGLPIRELQPEQRAVLLQHAWPGNVRELQNTAERFALGLGLGLDVPGSEPATSLASGGSLGEQVDAFERALIAAELNRPHGSLRSVAEALGLPRKTLHDKLRKHGLSFADAGGSSPDDND